MYDLREVLSLVRAYTIKKRKIKVMLERKAQLHFKIAFLKEMLGVLSTGTVGTPQNKNTTTCTKASNLTLPRRESTLLQSLLPQVCSD